MISIIPHRRVPGWPAGPHPKRVGELLTPGRAWRVSLTTALNRRWTTDAHALAYPTPNGRRLRATALPRIQLALTTLWIDVDCPEVHGSKREAPESWVREQLAAVRRLAELHPGPVAYTTRGGIRVVWRMETFRVTDTASARAWRQLYTVAVCYVRRVSGLDPDIACGDWQRLYRLPHVVRDGVASSPEFVGSPNAVGVWDFNPLDDDIAEARERMPRAFEAPRIREIVSCGAHDGRGLFYHLLLNDGSIVRPHGEGAFVIRCPNEAAHSTGETGDGSTLLYLPYAGSEVGIIDCQHAHCRGMRAGDWLARWSYGERDRAREQGGISCRATRRRTG